LSRGYEGCFKKVPYSVLPRDRAASLASLGTASLLASFGTASHMETPRLAPRGDISHPVFPRRVSAEGPLACASGRQKRGGSGREPFSVVSSEARNLHPLSCLSPCSAKSSEGSLTTFGMTYRDVLPRRVSAEGPLASLGVTKKEARGDKKAGSRR
jgi:hypothetical protein